MVLYVYDEGHLNDIWRRFSKLCFLQQVLLTGSGVIPIASTAGDSGHLWNQLFTTRPRRLCYCIIYSFVRVKLCSRRALIGTHT